MRLFIVLGFAFIISTALFPRNVLSTNDALANGEEIRHKFIVCAKDEHVCPYYATCCKLGEEYCSNKSKNCEKVLLQGETLHDVCCGALHDAAKLSRPGVRVACQLKYGTIDLWPHYCTVSTTGANIPHRLPPITDSARWDMNTNGFDEPRKLKILENDNTQPVPAALTDEAADTHSVYRADLIAVSVVAAVLVGTIIFLFYRKKIKKGFCFTRQDVNSDVENTAESNNFDNKQMEQTEMLASVAYSSNELRLREQGLFQAAVTGTGETSGGPPVGPGASEPNGGSTNMSDGEDVTTETTRLTGSPGQLFLE